MTFVNQYIKPSLKLRSAASFHEGGDAYVYAVGEMDREAVVIKTRPNGETVWCRSLFFTDAPLRFYEIVQLYYSDVFRYVLSAYDGVRFYLVGINEEGNIAWSQEVETLDADVHARLVATYDKRGFYLIYSDKNDADSELRLRILQLHASGNLVASRIAYIDDYGTPFVVNTAGVHSRGLVIGGRMIGLQSIGFILDLDTTLASGPALLYEDFTVQDILVYSVGKYVVSAYSNQDNAVVLFSEGMGTPPLYQIVPNSQNQNSVLCFGEEGRFYLSIISSSEGRLHYLDTSFNPIWSKGLHLGANNLGLRSLDFDPQLSVLTFTTLEVWLLGQSGAGFDPCIAFDLDRIKLAQRNLKGRRFGGGTRPWEIKLSKRDGQWGRLEPVKEAICNDGGDLDEEFELGKDASIQSAHLYLQAAGSLGAESTKGMHLRWLLKKALATHLPKADYAVPYINFNKPDDYVRIFRAKYQPKAVTVSLKTHPALVSNYEWVYNNGSDAFYLHFLDHSRYDTVHLSINPSSNPQGFLAAYGNGLLELEHKTRLSFALTLTFDILTTGSQVDLELLSVEENLITAPKGCTLRQHYLATALNGTKLLSENIRSARFRGYGAFLTGASFEFYDDFITTTARNQGWQFLGKYALTKDTNTAYHQLEPAAGAVHGKWGRFNDGAFVNVNNYKAKWNSGSLPVDNRIVSVVDKYIGLSNNPLNPTATEMIYFNDPSATPIPGYEPEPGFDPTENQFELSNLYVLQLAAMDYHIARMLGLGTLDLSGVVMSDTHVYLAEYFTVADLGDGLGARTVQHLYMSLPTRLSDERLPIPIDLKAPVPGVFFGADTEAPAVLTDANGYGLDGHTRYLSLYHVPLPEEVENAPFNAGGYAFVSADRTLPVFAGIEYRNTGAPVWMKPELPFDGAWLNVDATVIDEYKQETRMIVLPDPLYPVFVHRERHSGWHDYGSYGINWFSRATPSTVIHSIQTTIVPSNLLLPPTNVNAVLILKEQPLMLTSADEQFELMGLTASDKTFIRLTYDYNHGQELIDYHREINGVLLNGYVELPDAEELFAEDIEIYFRNHVPESVGGKVISVVNHANPIMSVVTTGEYVFESMGYDPISGLPNEVLTPTINPLTVSHFLGGVFVVNGLNYTIYQIDNSGTYPKFTVFKVDVDGNAVNLSTTIPASELTAPPVGGMFSAVENMALIASWGASGNPLGFHTLVEPTTIHREVVLVSMPDGNIDTHVQKFRGIYEDALIEAVLEDHDGDSLTPNIHNGLYKLTFPGFVMAQHSQSTGPGHRLEFWSGVVRIHTSLRPNGPRKELRVIRTENIGMTNDLVLYVADGSFSADPGYDAIPLGTQKVNYYPGYRAYLFADPTHNLSSANILPSGSDLVRYSIFGLRSHDVDLGYYSRMSVPALMFAQAVSEPEMPRLPGGGTYATRPDFYGKATYTFTTVFEHKPYSAQYLRASDIQIIKALWTSDAGPGVWTAMRVQDEIFGNGAADWFDDRWRNLVGFDYAYLSDPGNDGLFEKLPPGGVSLPLPNNPRFITAINAFVDEHNDYFNVSVPPITTITSLFQVVIPGSPNNTELQVKDFVRETVQNCFVPMTEIPVIYANIKGSTYEPIPKKQVVRDRNGQLLAPSHPDFDMAPMAKIIGTSPDETQFTDFNLDGASNAHYFYAVREFNLKMQAGPYSPIKGPVHMVHTGPPRSPEVIKVIPILESRNPSVAPAIELRINGYPAVQHIRYLQVYRATNGLDARSVRTMKKLPVIDVIATGMATDTIWVIRDDFADLGYVPYGDPLFYMLTVSREVVYEDRNGLEVPDLVPSDPSKMVVTNIVENFNPEAPTLSYYATAVNASHELTQVTLVWDKMVHNGKYHLMKRNSAGNWNEITVVAQNNAMQVIVPLASTTLGSGTLLVEDANGNPVYHHFKVVSENFAGMISRQDNVLTIHQASLWHDIGDL